MLTSILRMVLLRSKAPFLFNREDDGTFDFGACGFGIYIHIPFCRTICPFCPYYKERYYEKKADSFASALIKEIGRRNQGKRLPADSLYMGGGSPALMVDYFPEIFAEIHRCYGVTGDMGIELFPDNVTEGVIQKVKKAGFNMVSIGIQSFQEGLNRNLGRKHQENAEKIRLAREAGFAAVDVDLIFGIPGQTEADIIKDFSTAVESGATQVSTYPFIDFSYASNRYKPLSQKEKKRLLECLVKASGDLGFERTSVWTFARKGTPKYSSITRDKYIGFGPSAASLSMSKFKVNVFSVEEYQKKIDAGEDAAALCLEFNKRARIMYWLFWSFYNLEVNQEGFKRLFDSEIGEYLGWEMGVAVLLGLLKKTPDGYRLTDKGAYCFHRVEQHYTHQYIDKMWNTCMKNPWPESLVLY